MNLDEAKRIFAALEREEVRYVLVGSMAMAVQGLIRATRDMDFFVSPTPDNVERLRRALKSLYDDAPNIDQITAADLGGEYPAIQYGPPDSSYSLDILSRLGEAFNFDDLEAEETIVDGIVVKVATPRMLYRMKRDTVRPQDRLDAEAISKLFDIHEEQ